jgi:hypothetical protein
VQIVPLAATPSQNAAAALNGQACEINVYQLGDGDTAALYMDLIANAVPIFTTRITRAYGGLPGEAPPWMLAGLHYEGFAGDLLFLDTQAGPTVPTLDPEYAGLGARWQLMYFSPADLTAAGLTE